MAHDAGCGQSHPSQNSPRLSCQSCRRSYSREPWPPHLCCGLHHRHCLQSPLQPEPHMTDSFHFPSVATTGSDPHLPLGPGTAPALSGKLGWELIILYFHLDFPTVTDFPPPAAPDPGCQGGLLAWLWPFRTWHFGFDTRAMLPDRRCGDSRSSCWVWLLPLASLLIQRDAVCALR